MHEDRKEQQVTEMAQAFEEYSVEEFISEIEEMLGLPTAILQQGIWDFQTRRNVSLVEHLILLAQGNVSESFLPILCAKEGLSHAAIYQQGMTRELNPSFCSLASLLALVKGDNLMLLKYGGELAASLGLGYYKEHTPLDKLQALSTLCHGIAAPAFIKWLV